MCKTFRKQTTALGGELLVQTCGENRMQLLSPAICDLTKPQIAVLQIKQNLRLNVHSESR